MIRKAVFAYLRFFKERPEQVELMILERAEFRDRKISTYFAYREDGKCRWHNLLRELIASGRVRDIPVCRIDDVLSDLVYGTMVLQPLLRPRTSRSKRRPRTSST